MGRRVPAEWGRGEMGIHIIKYVIFIGEIVKEKRYYKNYSQQGSGGARH